MSEKIKSDVTGLEYNPSEVCRIINPKQASMYLKHGARLYDAYSGYDGVLVMIFNRKETSDLYDKWCNHELK